jgi:hypothetical protein
MGRTSSNRSRISSSLDGSIFGKRLGRALDDDVGWDAGMIAMPTTLEHDPGNASIEFE